MPQGSISIVIPNETIGLRELGEWFRADDTFRGKVNYKERPIEPGQMGGMTEAIVIAVGSGGAATTLIRQLFIWLGRRGERYTAHLTLKDGKGREVSLDINGLTDSDAITRKFFDFFSSGNDSE
jgi:Effector Associated Constant Component 1